MDAAKAGILLPLGVDPVVGVLKLSDLVSLSGLKLRCDDLIPALDLLRFFDYGIVAYAEYCLEIFRYELGALVISLVCWSIAICS